MTACVVLLAGSGLHSADALDPPELTLAAAIERVRRQAPAQQGAREREAAARGALHQAGRLPNPSLQLSAENITMHGGSLTASDPSLDFFALVTQPFELGGKRAARTGAAAAAVERAQAERRQIDQVVTLRAMQLYLDTLRSRERVATLAAHHDDMSSLVERLRLRVDDGYAARADLWKLEAEAARVATQLADERLTLGSNARALTALLGDPVLVASEALRMPRPLTPPTDEATDFVERVVDARTDVAMARAEVAAAHQELALEKARQIPDPALTAGYKRTTSADTAVAGVVIPLPVFDRNTGNVERAAAAERAATSDLESILLQARAQVRTLLQVARDLYERSERAVAQRLRPAEGVRRATRAAFHEGGGELLPLVDAERVYVDAQLDVLDLRLTAFAKSFELHLLDPQRGTPWIDTEGTTP